MNLKIKKLHPLAVLPRYGTDGAGAFDLFALNTQGTLSFKWNFACTTCTIRTGLAFEIPPGHVMLAFSRSGHGFNHNTRLANCVGVIDSDYRGEVLVKLTRDDGEQLRFEPNKAIAQAIVIPIPRIEFLEVEELGTTERGTGGFGSTDEKIIDKPIRLREDPLPISGNFTTR